MFKEAEGARRRFAASPLSVFPLYVSLFTRAGAAYLVSSAAAACYLAFFVALLGFFEMLPPAKVAAATEAIGEIGGSIA